MKKKRNGSQFSNLGSELGGGDGGKANQGKDDGELHAEQFNLARFRTTCSGYCSGEEWIIMHEDGGTHLCSVHGRWPIDGMFCACESNGREAKHRATAASEEQRASKSFRVFFFFFPSFFFFRGEFPLFSYSPLHIPCCHMESS